MLRLDQKLEKKLDRHSKANQDHTLLKLEEEVPLRFLLR